jgi:hypothetical protein
MSDWISQLQAASSVRSNPPKGSVKVEDVAKISRLSLSRARELCLQKFRKGELDRVLTHIPGERSKSYYYFEKKKSKKP